VKISSIRSSLAAAAAVLLAGCGGGSMTMDTPTFPVPLVDEMNLHVGLRLSPEMRAFSHEENVLGREKWSVDLGDANAKLFEDLFGHMFRQVTLLEEDDNPADMPIDVLIESSIDAFEFATPEQTGAESFAMWIRYRLKVYDRNGDMLANWPVSAYGKSEAGGIGKADSSLEKAALLAMRDAAALMIMKLEQETGIGALARRSEPADEQAVTATVVEDDAV
jgi:hypothetical protein